MPWTLKGLVCSDKWLELSVCLCFVVMKARTEKYRNEVVSTVLLALIGLAQSSRFSLAECKFAAPGIQRMLL